MSKTRDVILHPDIVIPGDIPAHPRPKVGKFGTYYPKSYKQFQQNAEYLLRSQWRGLPLITNAVELEIFFLCTKPKSKIRKTTAHHRFPRSRARQDLDNMIKSILDALQDAGIIKNDNLVYSIKSEAWYAGIDEKIEATIKITEIKKARWIVNSI